MGAEGSNFNDTLSTHIEDDDMELKRGPWTVEEDFKLINYITTHGEGRWNSLARCAGLKRTGKSCRLRWLNYLCPDVRRGNITLEEQLLILELHSRWGNRWSKIAQYLPGRTDNEIKNYWRTRVQKHAKLLKCDVNSKQFKDTIRYLWMPRLVERIQASTATAAAATTTSATSSLDQGTTADIPYGTNNKGNDVSCGTAMNNYYSGAYIDISSPNPNNYTSPENSSVAISPASDLTDYYNIPINNGPTPSINPDWVGQIGYNYSENFIAGPFSENYYVNHNGLDDFHAVEQNNFWFDAGYSSNSLWNFDQEAWFLQQQDNNGSM